MPHHTHNIDRRYFFLSFFFFAFFSGLIALKRSPLFPFLCSSISLGVVVSVVVVAFFCCFLLCAFSFRCWWCWFYIYIHSTICRAVCIHFVESPFLMLIVVFFSLFAIPFFCLFFLSSTSPFAFSLHLIIIICSNSSEYVCVCVMAVMTIVSLILCFFFISPPLRFAPFPISIWYVFFSFLQIIIQNVFYTHSHTK